jgi:hypothetical protein
MRGEHVSNARNVACRESLEQEIEAPLPRRFDAALAVAVVGAPNAMEGD